MHICPHPLRPRGCRNFNSYRTSSRNFQIRPADWPEKISSQGLFCLSHKLAAPGPPRMICPRFLGFLQAPYAQCNTTNKTIFKAQQLLTSWSRNSNAKNVLGSQRKMLVIISFLIVSHIQFTSSPMYYVQPRILHLLYDKLKHLLTKWKTHQVKLYFNLATRN